MQTDLPDEGVAVLAAAQQIDARRTSTWICVTGVVAIALAVLAVVLHLTGHVSLGH